MAKVKIKVASNNPDDMVAAGLPDDFNGTVIHARFKPYDYDGKLDHHILTAALTIQPDSDTGLEPFTAYYSAGNLEHWIPCNGSMDDPQPVDLENGEGEDLEGTFVGWIGNDTVEDPKLSNSSNWAHFTASLKDAGFPADDFSPNIAAMMEGANGHWNRINQRERSGLADQGDGGRKRQILVITQYQGRQATTPAVATKAAVATQTQATATPPATGDFDDRVAGFLLEQLAEAGGTLAKSALPKLVMASFQGAEKAKSVGLVGGKDSVAWLSGREEFSFDGTNLTLG